MNEQLLDTLLPYLVPALAPILLLAFKAVRRAVMNTAARVGHSLGWGWRKRMEIANALILAELKPNGGASLRDALNRVEMAQHVNRATMRAWMLDPDKARVEVDAKGESAFCDETFMRWSQRTEHDVQGWGWLNVLNEDVREDIRDTVRDKVKFATRRIYLEPVEGEPIAVDCCAALVRHPFTGEVTGWIWSFERRRNTAALHEKVPLHMREDNGA